MTTSISEIRKDFPLLMSNDVIYLDTAATSQKPSCVLEAERTFYEKYNANPCADYTSWEAATEKYEEAREMVGSFKCQRGGGDRFRPQCHGRLKSGGLQSEFPGAEAWG